MAKLLTDINAEYVKLRMAEATAPKKKKKGVQFQTQYGNVDKMSQVNEST
jgi:hypothetical protein